jgi:hypothetical protein
VEPVVDSLVEASIEVKSVVSLRVVGISADADDLMEFELVSRTVNEAVDSSNKMEGLLIDVDSLCRVVKVSGKIVVVISLPNSDDDLSSNSSEVVVMALISLLDVDISNEDFVSVIIEAVVDVIYNSLLSAVLDESLVVGPSLLLDFFSVVTAFVSNTIDEDVNRVFELSVLLTA